MDLHLLQPLIERLPTPSTQTVGFFSIALKLTSPEYAHFEDSMDCDDRTSSKASGCPNTVGGTPIISMETAIRQMQRF